jgi:hypothetical protein
MHELPVFSSRSSGVLHSSTLVLATFGGKFAHGRSSLIVMQNVLRTSCIFPHLTREFLQNTILQNAHPTVNLFYH